MLDTSALDLLLWVFLGGLKDWKLSLELSLTGLGHSVSGCLAGV